MFLFCLLSAPIKSIKGDKVLLWGGVVKPSIQTESWSPQSLPKILHFETVARRRSAALLSEFGLGHVREYAPFDLILSALHLILRAKSQHI